MCPQTDKLFLNDISNAECLRWESADDESLSWVSKSALCAELGIVLLAGSRALGLNRADV